MLRAAYALAIYVTYFWRLCDRASW